MYPPSSSPTLTRKAVLSSRKSGQRRGLVLDRRALRPVKRQNAWRPKSRLFARQQPRQPKQNPHPEWPKCMERPLRSGCYTSEQPAATVKRPHRLLIGTRVTHSHPLPRAASQDQTRPPYSVLVGYSERDLISYRGQRKGLHAYSQPSATL
ncbi:uncharacterized protein CTRU02_214372 [Colletotrichum truncatum]|uniref:Uncharacterized protein n=1 Tax=Colletotrichum truncatum TaxID=5467 RepID=A0ACC3YEM9_COLTU|nr:uncharacterized protein CTRU02_13523 [Colletotrichum truncatum]KAF6783287.1 hypothetical protein CTRU02_13523 [Colletotrichum truncatum]